MAVELRGKIVRSDFIQGITDHWQASDIVKNGVRPDLWAGVEEEEEEEEEEIHQPPPRAKAKPCRAAIATVISREVATLSLYSAPSSTSPASLGSPPVSSARRERMVVLRRLLLVLLGLPREWSPGCPCVLGRLLRLFCAGLTGMRRANAHSCFAMRMCFGCTRLFY